MSTIAALYHIKFPIQNYTPPISHVKYLKEEIKETLPFKLLPNISCGWELEVEGLTEANITPEFKNHTRIYFVSVEDNSLKDYGTEYVTKGPLQNNNLEFSLLEINHYNKLLKHGFKFTHRCSFHVHLDVTDLSTEQVSNIILLYILTEPLFLSLCELHRKGNSYCIPLNILQLTQKDIKQIHHSDSKYWALSMNRLRDLGTLEFRSLHGTTDLNLLFTWIKLIQSLKHTVQNHPTSQLRSQVMRLSDQEDILNFLTNMIPIPHLYNKLPELTKELEESLFNAKYYLGNY